MAEFGNWHGVAQGASAHAISFYVRRNFEPLKREAVYFL